jgi:hypothetical protein
VIQRKSNQRYADEDKDVVKEPTAFHFPPRRRVSPLNFMTPS